MTSKLIYKIKQALLYCEYLSSLDSTERASPKYRFIREQLLQKAIKTLRKELDFMGSNRTILINNKESMTLVGNVFLYNTHGKYLKQACMPQCEAEEIDDFLDSNHIQWNSMFDVGANCGEISLYMARKHSTRKIVAIEPSTENYDTFSENFRFNHRINKLDNLLLLKCIVADSIGEMEITIGNKAGNTIITDDRNALMPFKKKDTETVRSTTLMQIVKDTGIKPDFVKLDIEGAEPLLIHDLLEIRPKAIFTEVSRQNDMENYLKFVFSLLDDGYICRLEDWSIVKDKKEMKQHLINAWTCDEDNPHKFNSTNLWLLRQQDDK